jgi:hypothetical protein
MIDMQRKRFEEQFAKFSKPFSLCSNRFENPTAECGVATLGLPARHPEIRGE